MKNSKLYVDALFRIHSHIFCNKSQLNNANKKKISIRKPVKQHDTKRKTDFLVGSITFQSNLIRTTAISKAV